MDTIIRPLEDHDRPLAERLLDDAVGPGFWSFEDAGDGLCFVAATETGVGGVVLARLTPATLWPSAGPGGGRGGADRPGGGDVLHVRELAVARDCRRAGLGSRLLRRAEREGAARGARGAFVYAWLPAGRPEPDAVPFYVAAGYVPGADLPGFYAAGSLAAGARCPYCGAPPCRCAALPLTKLLATG